MNAQFIIISLRPECFDLADRIIGIYKVYNKSNSNWIDPKVLDVLNPHYKPYKRPELPSVKVTKENKGNEGENSVNSAFWRGHIHVLECILEKF